MIKYTYYGHASFLLDDGTSKVLWSATTSC